MPLKNVKVLLRALPLCLLFAGLSLTADAAVSKTSKRVIRYASPPLTVVPGFTAAALSTSSIQWSWSTGSFTGSGITGFHLYSSTATASIDLPLGTSYYIDAGLGVNKQYTRWITSYDGTGQGSDSDHIEKYTYALPPFTLALSTLTAESVYVTWQFSSATAYAVECSTNGGVDYVRNRDVFVPWQTITLLSNRNYLIRLGAVNGDNELTPGVYSVARTTITPPLDLTMTGVAVSSYTIEWRWSTGTFTGTGISGYRISHSTTTVDDTLPADDFEGEPVTGILGAAATSWIETFVDGSTTAVAANSRHTRWIKAVGNILSDGAFLVSRKKTNFQRYTYAIAPATTTAVWLDPAPYWTAHVWENSLSLIWTPRLGPSEASKYVVDYSTVAGFTVAVTSKIASGNPDTISGLTDNTKYDLRLGAINGDDLQTPADGKNPLAYSKAYKVITRPQPPSAFLCNAFTDTAMKCAWSTSTYVNPGYIDGYGVGKLLYRTVNGVVEIYWDPWDFLPGVASNEYSLNYLLTNSSHTLSVWVSQTDPDWVPGNVHYDANDWDYYYNNFGSYRLDKDGATFATPPNDVSFNPVGARSVGLRWNEPIIPATKYRVERSTNTGERGPWVFISSVTGSYYGDTGLLPGTTYSYRIGAINRLGFQTIGLSTATGGNRRDYSFVSSTVTKHTAPILSGTATSTTSINWSWTDVSPGVTVLSYNLYTSSEGVIASGLSAAT
ncbi:MAG: fibronectin type III domain-containing protein, partial [Elusimicrobiota bacterium]